MNQNLRIGTHEAKKFLRRIHKFIKAKKIPPRLAFNLDETGADKARDKKLYYGPRGSKNPIRFQSIKLNEHTSIILCICMDGTFSTPGIIHPTLLSSSDEYINKHVWFSSAPSGYDSKYVLAKYIHEVFIPHVKQKRTEYNLEDQPALLILDNHSSRYHALMLQECLDNNIFVYPLLPHTSQIFQPCDRIVNLKFKDGFTCAFQHKIGEERYYPNDKLVDCIFSGIQTSMTKDFIVESWRLCHLLSKPKHYSRIFTTDPTVIKGYKRPHIHREQICHQVSSGLLNTPKNIALIYDYEKVQEEKKLKKQELLQLK